MGESLLIQRGIMLLIIVNAIIIGLEIDPSVMDIYDELLLLVDLVILGVFVFEIVLHIYAHRLGFFRDARSFFDFAVVVIGQG